MKKVGIIVITALVSGAIAIGAYRAIDTKRTTDDPFGSQEVAS